MAPRASSATLLLRATLPKRRKESLVACRQLDEGCAAAATAAAAAVRASYELGSVWV
eukprot:CAMPEP_0178382550 /NCGR_PEP_ID=MMETSP0689_2-20121128/6550_1 /TAXON_ID=160604 /ORGANISM="Amphidinium massartii, Strain CS-259" /LENGTH=56 /DNA_ID=CAMNT_0020002755 /DNA_START=678 /DNA_END=848 /DNA_ORIENTATION=+